MAPYSLSQSDRFGLILPDGDGNASAISALQQLLADNGIRTVTADTAAGEAFHDPENPANAPVVAQWLRDHAITVLGFSYYLDPHEGAGKFALLLALLRRLKLLACQGGPLRALFFAGLPEACRMVRYRHREVTGVLCGNETSAEMLSILGIARGTTEKRS
jgi:hypothetical protein